MAPLKVLFFPLALVIGIGSLQCQHSPTVTISEAQNNSVVNLSKGQILSIRLRAQMGTGFTWVHVGKASLLREDGSSIESSTKDKPGGVETQVFRITALTPGTETLRYIYVQPWVKDREPAKSFEVKVVIRPD